MNVNIQDNIENCRISVCIATYNGEHYISEQLESIISQLNIDDEIIVSDDGSVDDTLKIVESYKKTFPNLTIVNGPRKGFSSNFGNAIKYACNEIILFSDQDDIWCDNKVTLIRKAFAEDDKITSILHTMYTFENDKKIDTRSIIIKYKEGVFKNFVKSCYWGCCMAVRANFIKRFIPFRDCCVGHDQLVGLMSEKFGETLFLDRPLIWHRLHANNTSNKRTIKQMLQFRLQLIQDYLVAKKKYMRNVP